VPYPFLSFKGIGLENLSPLTQQEQDKDGC